MPAPDNIVDLRSRREQEAWEVYRAAALTAQRTMNIADAAAAGRAWRAFLELYLPSDQRGSLIPLGGRSSGARHPGGA